MRSIDLSSSASSFKSKHSAFWMGTNAQTRVDILEYQNQNRKKTSRGAGYTLADILLRASVLGLLLDLEVHDEVQVVPEIVVLGDVVLETLGLAVEGVPFDAADETPVLHVVLNGLVLGSQFY